MVGLGTDQILKNDSDADHSALQPLVLSRLQSVTSGDRRLVRHRGAGDKATSEIDSVYRE